jgi:STE24 endopeptidase
MTQFVLILCFALIHVRDHFGIGGDHSPTLLPPLLVLVGTLMALWGLLGSVLMAAGRRLDRTGDRAAITLADYALMASRLVGGGAFVLVCLSMGWVDAVRRGLGNRVLLDEVVIVAPIIAFMLLTSWAYYPIEQRLREAVFHRRLISGQSLHASRSRGQFVMDSARHQILLMLIPLLVITAWSELALRIGDWMHTNLPQSAPTLAPMMEWAGILMAICLTPALIRMSWDTVQIGEGPLRRLVLGVCTQYGVRVRGPLMWRTHGAMVNGAILGMFWPARYLLLTDALLEELSAEQLEAVTAHEVAHVRHRHLIWLGVSVLTTVLSLGWTAAIVAHLAGDAWDPKLVEVSTTVASLVGALLVFGFVSRRFEWQADAFAAQHLSGRSSDDGVVTGEATNAVASALQAVADLNGIPVERWSYRHGSIEDRQRRVATLAGRRTGRCPIDRTASIIKLVTVIALAVCLWPIMLDAWRL